MPVRQKCLHVVGQRQRRSQKHQAAQPAKAHCKRQPEHREQFYDLNRGQAPGGIQPKPRRRPTHDPAKVVAHRIPDERAEQDLRRP